MGFYFHTSLSTEWNFWKVSNLHTHVLVVWRGLSHTAHHLWELNPDALEGPKECGFMETTPLITGTKKLLPILGESSSIITIKMAFEIERVCCINSLCEKLVWKHISEEGIILTIVALLLALPLKSPTWESILESLKGAFKSSLDSRQCSKTWVFDLGKTKFECQFCNLLLLLEHSAFYFTPPEPAF